MIRFLSRLFCLLTGHQRGSVLSNYGGIGILRREWDLRSGRYQMSTCLSCGVLLDEGAVPVDERVYLGNQVMWRRP